MTANVYTHISAISERTEELRALSTMLVSSIEAGDSLKEVSGGIFGLYSRVCGDLEASTNLVLDTLGKERANGLAISDPALIASLTGVSLSQVKQVLWAACRVDVEPCTDAAMADADALYGTLNVKLRAANLLEGVRGAISEISGQPPEVVAKVIEAINEAAVGHIFRMHTLHRSSEELQRDADELAEHRRKFRASKNGDVDVK